MTRKHMSNDEFLQRLSELFDQGRTKDHGSVFLTQKRMIHGEDIGVEALETTNDPFPDLNPSKSIPILVRATDGKSKASRAEKIKLSTIVEPDALDGFFIKYAEVCKLGMSGLKKRNRSKAKEKLKAKKKKLGGVAATGDVKKA